MRTVYLVPFPDGSSRWVVQDGDKVLYVVPGLDEPFLAGKEKKYKKTVKRLAAGQGRARPKFVLLPPKETLLFSDKLWRLGNALELYHRLLESDDMVTEWKKMRWEYYESKGTGDTVGLSKWLSKRRTGRPPKRKECPDTVANG